MAPSWAAGAAVTGGMNCVAPSSAGGRGRRRVCRGRTGGAGPRAGGSRRSARWSHSPARAAAAVHRSLEPRRARPGPAAGAAAGTGGQVGRRAAGSTRSARRCRNPARAAAGTGAVCRRAAGACPRSGRAAATSPGPAAGPGSAGPGPAAGRDPTGCPTPDRRAAGRRTAGRRPAVRRVGRRAGRARLRRAAVTALRRGAVSGLRTAVSTRLSRQQGFPAVGGQHDAFARFARRGLLALSTLRHRDSY